MTSPASRYNLVFYVNNKQWRVTPVSLKKPICFGMSEKCNVRLSSTGTLDLLDEHAWLQVEDDQIILKVEGKTKVNGEEIPKGKINYNIGDKIQFGEKDKLLLVLEVPALGEPEEKKEPKKPKEKKPKEKKPADETTTKSPKEKKTTLKEKRANEEPKLIEGTKPIEGAVPLVPTTSEENKTETSIPTEAATTVEPESPKASTRTSRATTPKTKAEVAPKSPRKPTPTKETKAKTPQKAAKVATPPKPKVVASPKTPKQTKPPKTPLSPPKIESSTEGSQSLFPSNNDGKATLHSWTPEKEEKRYSSRSTAVSPSKEVTTTPSKGKTQQTDVVVEISESGNTYKIPPLRTRDQVDRMELEEILLEMVNLSRGHDVTVSKKYIQRWYAKKQFTAAQISEAFQKLATEGKVLTKDFHEGPNGKKVVTCYYDINQPVTDDEGERDQDEIEKKETPQALSKQGRQSKRKLDNPESVEQQQNTAPKKRKLQNKNAKEEPNDEIKEEKGETEMEVEKEENKAEEKNEEIENTTSQQQETKEEVKETEIVEANSSPQQKEDRAEPKEGSGMEIVSENGDETKNSTVVIQESF